MVEKEKDVINFAHRVISFRMNIIKACRAKGIVPPTDEQISEYINGYGMNLIDFMTDYTEHEGIFRNLQTPFEQFSKAVANISWGEDAPTKEEIKAFFEAYGNDAPLFCQRRKIKEMHPIERKTYLKTIGKLSEEKLVELWNAFIGESELYGSDNHIYDLTSLDDSEYLTKYMDGAHIKAINNMIAKGVRFIQWFDLNNGSIREVSDIKHTITAHWNEIFKRIMLYPSCYNFDAEIYSKGDASTYFDDVFYPVIVKEVGYIVDGDKGTIEKVEKK